MNTKYRILALCVFVAAMSPVLSECAIIFIDEPQPLELTLGTPVVVDLNQDGITDFTVNYYGAPTCISNPEGGGSFCSQGVTIDFGSNLQLLGSLHNLDPLALPSGYSVRSNSTNGIWLETFTTPISLIYEYGTVSYARQDYPDYTGDLEWLAIGFRLVEQDSYFYGYFDVSLATSMPHITGIVLADNPNVALTVVPIPEPNVLILVTIGGFLLWSVRRRQRRWCNAR